MIRTQEITLNLGPQHPSTHGVYRCVLTLDGEYITKAENHTGYLHRGLEKLAESRTYTQFIPYTDRLDYLSGMLNNWAYVATVEKLMGIEVPERAEYIRVIVGELSRIASHLVFVGSYALDLAAFTGWMYCFRDRETVLDLLEMVSGSRMTFSYMRIGGVAEDLPDEFFPAVKKFIAEFPKAIEEYHKVISGNEILIARSKNVGVLSKELALAYGVTGPNLRASGVPYDLRKAEPYSVYDRFDFEVPVLYNGDSYDRYMIRLLEMEQSLKIIEQALDQIPDGPIMAKVPKVIKPPAGEVYHRMEISKGQLGFYIVSDGSPKPYRLHIHSPSFVNLGVFPEIVKGCNIQDAIVVLASIDIVLGEIDR
ncbi:NADH-quinone oxidoreductase subunit D [Carboxydocella sp. JDF658]|uniref:NADH-quinone oxidoreductase subunit D n=1 Tax=Carboxydocella sp. JDF658 TaxID=1926600 RepID=UPI0009AC8FCA|nr:NADH-quinone oxidoreductase subunit D [Carboxydocella sp. JDF658]GAW31429.1 NADH-quinone oxidoreductase subunit D [Carboxydocella sp. JDF658]